MSVKRKPDEVDMSAKRVKQESIDSLDSFDPMQNPNLLDMTLDTTDMEIKSDFSDHFIIRFAQGIMLSKAVQYLSVLNKSVKCNIICKLIQDPFKNESQTNETVFLSMHIRTETPQNVTKCTIPCTIVQKTNDSFSPLTLTPVKTRTILSQFACGWEKIRNVFSFLDDQSEVFIRREQTHFFVEYETTEDVSIKVDFGEIAVTNDHEYENPIDTITVVYKYQLEIIPKKIKRFVEQADKIENTLVNVLIYQIPGKANVLKMELDARFNENKETCEVVIGSTRMTNPSTTIIPDDAPVEATIDSVSPPVKSSRYFKEISDNNNNLVFVNFYDKGTLVNIFKMNVNSLNMFVTFDLDENDYVQNTPALFLHKDANGVELSIYVAPLFIQNHAYVDDIGSLILKAKVKK